MDDNVTFGQIIDLIIYDNRLCVVNKSTGIDIYNKIWERCSNPEVIFREAVLNAKVTSISIENNVLTVEVLI